MDKESRSLKKSQHISILSMALNNIFALILGFSLVVILAVLLENLNMNNKSYLEERAFGREILDGAVNKINEYTTYESAKIIESVDDQAPISLKFARMEPAAQLKYLKILQDKKDPSERMEEIKKYISKYKQDYFDYDESVWDVYYTKKDLLAWAEEGMSKTSKPSYIVYREDKNLFFLQDEDGKIIDRDLPEDVLEGEKEKNYVKILNEKYLPVEPLDEKGEKMDLYKISRHDLDFYRRLMDDLAASQSSLLSYRTNKERIEDKAGNISYEIKILPTGNTYKFESVKAKEPVYAAPINISDMRISVGEGEWQEEMSQALKSYPIDPINFRNVDVTIKIDRTLQINDALKDKISYYPRLQKMYKWSIAVAFISFLAWLISLCLALVKTSNRPYPLLSKLEGALPTEVYIILSMIFTVITIAIMKACVFAIEREDIWAYVKAPLSQPIWFFIGLLFLFLNTLGLYILSAFFRKARQGTFLKGSLLWYMGQFLARLRRAFLDGKAGRYRLSLSYLTWIFLCLLSFFIIFGIFSIQSSELFILMILLSLAGPLFFMIKKDQDDAVVLDYLKELSAGIEVENPDLSNIKGTDKEMLEGISNLAKNLRTSMEESLKNERLQTDLITNVSHDLRTPLTSIISYVDLLKSGNLSEEEEKKYLDILANKAERLKILMNDLIDVSRASSGALEIEEDALDFSELILQNLAEMSEGWEKKDLEPVIELPEDKTLIMTDGAKLSRIVENLISNAQKYSQEATRVYVKLEKTDKEAVFYIRNTSANPLNISPQEMMERFRRSDVARSSEGSGLGLSIAKNLSSRLKIDLDLQIQADLFTVILRCPLLKKADL